MTSFLSFKRILKTGWRKFLRDKSASTAALVVMAVVLFLVSAVLFLRGMSDFMLAELQERIDISAYFAETTTEEKILEIRDALLELPEVRGVEYVSKEEALGRFRESRGNDIVVLRSLEAVGGNPLLASLDIKAWELDSFERISVFLENSPYAAFIDNIDYGGRASVIERASRIATGIQVGVGGITAIIGIIALLVVFNTIRLTIYASREEIEVMRLVGASRWFVRGPFLLQGAIVGIIATLVTQFLIIPVLFIFSPSVEGFTEGFSLWGYYTGNLIWLFGMQLLIGIALGVFSSWFAIRRYLRV